MTDTNNAGAGGAPHIEPVAEVAAPEMSDFDKQLDEFLNHSMLDDGDDAVGAEPQVNAPPAVDPAAVPAEGLPSATKVAGEGDPPVGEPAKAPAAADPAAVDPALVMEVLGFKAGPAAQPKAAPTGEAAPKSDAPPAPAGADDPNAPFMPFRNDFKLPVEMTTALFESEDSETRSRALVALLSSALNACAQVVDERIKEFHAPRIMQAYEGKRNFDNNLENFRNDMFGDSGFPELRPYEEVVGKAIQALARAPGGANMPWEEAKVKVAALARTAVKQLTGQDITPQVKSTAAAPAPKKPAHDAFLTDGARPAGIGDPADANSPSAVLQDLAAF